MKTVFFKIIGQLDLENPAHTFLSKKMYDGLQKGGLTIASNCLTSICLLMEIEFRSIIEGVLHIICVL